MITKAKLTPKSEEWTYFNTETRREAAIALRIARKVVPALPEESELIVVV